MSIAAEDLQATIQTWEVGTWSLAALALAARGDGPPELIAAARQLLAAAGLTGDLGEPMPGPGGTTTDPRQVASQAAAALHLASGLASGRGCQWAAQGQEALLAQGRASAGGARPFAQFMLPMMGDLAGRLAAPGARMLDVGTGIAALAVDFAQVFPQLQVLGIDILDSALHLARQAIAASDVAGRVTVRKQDVAGFTDGFGFDLAWIPAPFIPQQVLQAGLARVTAALHPGGWLMIGHGKLCSTPVQDALTRLRTVVYGGTPLDASAACQLLTDAGLTSVRPMPTPPGVPAITFGQKPA